MKPTAGFYDVSGALMGLALLHGVSGWVWTPLLLPLLLPLLAWRLLLFLPCTTATAADPCLLPRRRRLGHQGDAGGVGPPPTPAPTHPLTSHPSSPASFVLCFPAEEAQATKEMREEFRPVTIEELEGRKRKVRLGWCVRVLVGAVSPAALPCAAKSWRGTSGR